MAHDVALRLTSWNIQGSLSKKCVEVDFLDSICKYDVVCIQETWLKPEDNFHIDGYHYFRSDRKLRKQSRRNADGVALLFKRNLAKGISKLHSNNSDIIWCKLGFTGL